jgi:hypothetical protein
MQPERRPAMVNMAKIYYSSTREQVSPVGCEAVAA